MTLSVDENGTVFIHQGDSGELVINGISTDKNYQVYFAVQTLNREPVGNELVVNSQFKSFVKFNLTSSFTNLLTVPDDEGAAVYHYGLKMCDNDGNEDTLFVSKADYGQPNNIVVFPKVAEGNNE